MRIRLHYIIEFFLAAITVISFFLFDILFNTILSSPISELSPFKTLTLLFASIFTSLIIAESITQRRNKFSMNLIQLILSLALPILLLISVLPVDFPSIGLSVIGVIIVFILTYIRNKTAFEEEYQKQHRFSFNASSEILLISSLPFALIIWCLTSPLSISQLFDSPLMVGLFSLTVVSLSLSTLYRMFADNFEYTRKEIVYLVCIGICIGIISSVGGVIVSHPVGFLLFSIVVISAVVQRIKQITEVASPSS